MSFPGLAPQAVYLCLVCIVTRVLQGPPAWFWKDVVSAGPQEHWPPSWGLRHRRLIYPGAFHVWGLLLLFTLFIHVFKAVGGRIGLKSETQNLQVCRWEVACHRRHRVCARPVPSRTWPWALWAHRPELVRASSLGMLALQTPPLPASSGTHGEGPRNSGPFQFRAAGKTPGAPCLSGQQGGCPGRGMRCGLGRPVRRGAQRGLWGQGVMGEHFWQHIPC